MKQYLDLCKKILEEGTKKDDRTKTGTISIFGHQMRFDLSKGFPLLTTKKLHIRSIIHELLWFLSGDTNIKYLHDNNVHIWDEWRMPYLLDRELVFIKPKQCNYEPYNGNFSYKGLNIKANSIDNKLADLWVRVMRKCYDKTYYKYNSYGKKGISVHKKWHNPATFINDVKKLPHWYYKQKNWDKFDLDKDYYGANQYGPETCIWLHENENVMYTRNAKPIEITDNEGNTEIFITLNDAARKKNISNSTLSRFIKDGVPKILKRGNKVFLGWEFKELELKDKLLRMKIINNGDLGPVYGHQWRSWPGKNGEVIDQISNVIQEIKSNPNSRRLIVTAWNPGDIPYMALPPCHCLFQFYVIDGKLSCQLYQRSGDVFLGVPFNIASYALLVHMIAHVCDLDVGEFIHTLGDAHIYLNHLEQVGLQLTRTPRPLPKLIIKRKVDSIFDFKYEDFEIADYNPYPHIKGDVSV